MKFLQEMIAKKRQEQVGAAAPDAAASEDPGGFGPPDMSAVSPQAPHPSDDRGGEATASVIPIRQRDDAEPEIEEAPEPQRAFGAEGGSYDWDVAGIDLADEASEEPDDWQDDDAEAVTGRPEEGSEEALDQATEGAMLLESPIMPETAEAAPEVAAEAADAFESDDEPGLPASVLAAEDAGPEPAEAADHPDDDEIAPVPLRAQPSPADGSRVSSGDAAKKLEAQFQQRKIWDIQPPETPAAEPEESPAPTAPTAQAAPPEPRSRLDALKAAAAAAPAPETPEPEAEEADDPALGAAPARRRAGRVKTRLLGFHKPDTLNVDPISAAREAPREEAEIAFPVGWLVVLRGPGRGASFTLNAGASKIGRGEDQAVRLDFGDTSISRDNHAVVAYDDEQRRFFIGHGGKANLVRLNDMPVLSTEPLKDGDMIRIGETTLRFVALCGEDFSWDADGTHATDH